MSKGRKKSADVVTLPLHKRGVPNRDELSEVWVYYKHLQCHRFIEAARLPPMTKEEQQELFFDLLHHARSWAAAVDIVNKWRERKLGGSDKVAEALEKMGVGSVCGTHEQADRIRRLIEEEQAERAKRDA